jgi:hypothetical protein
MTALTMQELTEALSGITDDARHAARCVTTRSGAKTLTARQSRPLGATLDRCDPTNEIGARDRDAGIDRPQPALDAGDAKAARRYFPVQATAPRQAVTGRLPNVLDGRVTALSAFDSSFQDRDRQQPRGGCERGAQVDRRPRL